MRKIIRLRETTFKPYWFSRTPDLGNNFHWKGTFESVKYGRCGIYKDNRGCEVFVPQLKCNRDKIAALIEKKCDDYSNIYHRNP